MAGKNNLGVPVTLLVIIDDLTNNTPRNTLPISIYNSETGVQLQYMSNNDNTPISVVTNLPDSRWMINPNPTAPITPNLTAFIFYQDMYTYYPEVDGAPTIHPTKLLHIAVDERHDSKFGQTSLVLNLFSKNAQGSIRDYIVSVVAINFGLIDHCDLSYDNEIEAYTLPSGWHFTRGRTYSIVVSDSGGNIIDDTHTIDAHHLDVNNTTVLVKLYVD